VEALSLRERALSAYIDQLDNHPFTGTLYNYLGNDSLALDNFDKAVEYFSKALTIRKNVLGFYHQETARSLHDLGVAYKMKVSLLLLPVKSSLLRSFFFWDVTQRGLNRNSPSPNSECIEVNRGRVSKPDCGPLDMSCGKMNTTLA